MEYVAKRWFDGAKFLTTDVPTEILKMSEEVSKALTKELEVVFLVLIMWLMMMVCHG